MSINPASFIRMKRGNQIAVSGTIRTTNDNAVSLNRHCCEIWESAKPAQDAVTIVNGTAAPATINEFAANRAKSIRSRTSG